MHSKRKQWVRKVDVDGNLFWYRGCVGSESGSGASGVESQQPGYVVVFEHAEPSADDDNESVAVDLLIEERESLGQCQESADEISSVASAEPSLDPTAAEDAPERVPMMEGSHQIKVISASDADSMAAAHPTLSSSAKETIALASRDFPTKYAHFVVSSSSLIAPVEQEFIKLSVHRDFVLEESIEHISCVGKTHMRSFMRVNFLDESGVDAGGVHREWFLQVNELLLASELRVFVCTNKSEQSYYLNPNSAFDIGEEEHLAYYFAAGRLIGRALLDGGVWSFHLSLPLIKIILGIPVTFSDLEYLDPEACKSLVWLRDNDGAELLGLDFSVTEMRGDEVVTVDLIPNGRNIDVTDANKGEYLERKFRYMVFESVSSQLGMLLKGLYEVIPQELLMLFDAEEFDYLLCGTQEIDVDDWEVNTKYSSNLKWNGVLKWFWEVVREMPNEKRRRLLLFATGSSRVPLAGFAALTSYDGRLCPFALKGIPYSTTPYISSHACFNRLDLPMYKSKEELEMVLLAILDTESYGFTTV